MDRLWPSRGPLALPGTVISKSSCVRIEMASVQTCIASKEQLSSGKWAINLVRIPISINMLIKPLSQSQAISFGSTKSMTHSGRMLFTLLQLRHFSQSRLYGWDGGFGLGQCNLIVAFWLSRNYISTFWSNQQPLLFNIKSVKINLQRQSQYYQINVRRISIINNQCPDVSLTTVHSHYIENQEFDFVRFNDLLTNTSLSFDSCESSHWESNTLAIHPWLLYCHRCSKTMIEHKVGSQEIGLSRLGIALGHKLRSESHRSIR